METPQNKFIDNVYEKANEIEATFIIANAALDFYPVVYCSQGFFEDVGWTRNEVTTKDVYLNFMMGRSTDKKTIKKFERGISKKEFTQVEMILYSKGGTKRWFMLTLIPVKNNLNETSVFIIFFNFTSHTHTPIPDSPRRLWNIAKKAALNKPSLEYFRKHIDEKKDRERKRKYEKNTVKTKINNMFIPTYGLTRPQVPNHLIRHSNILKSIWDSIILICILYTSAMVPFLVAFQVSHPFIVIIDTIVDCMFIVDIILTFFTTYVGSDGEFVTNSKMIRRKYIKGWFTLDCIAALPYSVVQSFALNNPNSLSVLSGLKILRLIRLGKVSKKIGRYMQMSAVTLGVWLLLFSLCAHWMACGWYLIGTKWDKPGLKHHSWLNVLSEVTNQPFTYSPEGEIMAGTGPDMFSIYFSALYYTMSSLTTCGFGNIAPNTSAEKLFGCFTMLLGCVLYALIFGQVTNIISQLQKGSNEFTDKISSIKNFNTIYKMPPKVAKRLEDYFVATWTVTKGTDEQEILKPCPRDLQSDLCLNIHQAVFNSNPAFTHLSEAALRALSRYFWTIRTAPGDKLIYTGEEVNTVYFVAKGSLEVYSGDDLTGLIGPEDSFGKRLTDDHMTNSVYDVAACSFGAIHCIACDSVKEALALYPEEYDKIKYDLCLAFDITRQLETITKSGEVISTELSYKDKEKELQRTMSKGIQQITISEDGVIDLTSGGGNFLMDSQRTSNNADVLSGMSELKGELRRETERMNSKMGVVEAQMRLVLKLLRRNNKINDIDPEIGMQLDELMYYDNQQQPLHVDEVDNDMEWFVADAQGWKDGPSRETTGSSSRASVNKPPVSISSHSRVVSVATKPKPSPQSANERNILGEGLQPKSKKLSIVAPATAKPNKPPAVVDIQNKSSSTNKLSTAQPSANTSKTSPPVHPKKQSQTSAQPAPKMREDAATTKGKYNKTFEVDDVETIRL